MTAVPRQQIFRAPEAMVYFDWRGGVHPCFPLWMDFKWCFTQADNPKRACRALLEDYKRCLHKKDHLNRREQLKMNSTDMSDAELRQKWEQFQKDWAAKKSGEGSA